MLPYWGIKVSEYVESFAFSVNQFLLLDDLKHLTAVRAVQHNKFAEENGLASFMMSAKNGDQVNQAFWKVASTLAGNGTCLCYD